MDEDTFVAPAFWRRQVHPRRGGLAVPPTPLVPPRAWPAVVELLDSPTDRRDPHDERRRRTYREQVELILGHPDTDPELADEARSYLRDDHAVTPRGAAAVAVAVAAA